MEQGLDGSSYPDAVLLGWVHSHVRCGVTFSSTDRATQATWRESYSLGIVVDPWHPRELTVYRGPKAEALVAVASVAPVEGFRRGHDARQRAGVLRTLEIL